MASVSLDGCSFCLGLLSSWRGSVLLDLKEIAVSWGGREGRRKGREGRRKGREGREGRKGREGRGGREGGRGKRRDK